MGNFMNVQIRKTLIASIRAIVAEKNMASQEGRVLTSTTWVNKAVEKAVEAEKAVVEVKP
jgi:hypothetical protein